MSKLSENLARGGVMHLKRKKKEADSGSTLVAPLRAKESASPKSVTIRSRFNEAKSVATATGSKFEVVLIEEGLGNLNDCFYYTKQALQEAAALFNGKKCYADHPTQEEEQIRPERSTRDIIGYYENVQYQEQDGRGMLVGALPVLADPSLSWARALLSNSIDYAKQFPESEFVGLSINASGVAVAMPIDDFIRENSIPSSVLPKLQKAKDEGITEVRVVQSLKDIVSCDLVTEAGAGGKILKMIEQERKPIMGKKKESEKKEAEKKEAEKKEASEKHESEKKESEDAGHEDADQDKALFQKMIKQYLGDDHADDQEAAQMAKEAYEAYQSEGMEGEEAYEAAGKHLKMAAKIGAMKQKKESEKKEADGDAPTDKKPPEKKDADGDGDGDADDDHPKESEGEAKESAAALSKKLLAANAEIARLKEASKKYELTDYLEKKMAESKKPVAVTKKFREALGTPKSKAHIDESFKIFLAAYEGKESEEAEDFSGFVCTEKNQTQFTESDGNTKVGDLSDCVE